MNFLTAVGFCFLSVCHAEENVIDDAVKKVIQSKDSEIKELKIALAKLTVEKEKIHLEFLKAKLAIAKQTEILKERDQAIKAAFVQLEALEREAGLDFEEGVAVEVKIAEKSFEEIDLRNDVTANSVILNLTAELKGRETGVRAIKGGLVFKDLFGEVKRRVGWTINDPMTPGNPLKIEKLKIPYNQFSKEDKWLRYTELKNMKVEFLVLKILED